MAAALGDESAVLAVNQNSELGLETSRTQRLETLQDNLVKIAQGTLLYGPAHRWTQDLPRVAWHALTPESLRRSGEPVTTRDFTDFALRVSRAACDGYLAHGVQDNEAEILRPYFYQLSTYSYDSPLQAPDGRLLRDRMDSLPIGLNHVPRSLRWWSYIAQWGSSRGPVARRTSGELIRVLENAVEDTAYHLVAMTGDEDLAWAGPGMDDYRAASGILVPYIRNQVAPWLLEGNVRANPRRNADVRGRRRRRALAGEGGLQSASLVLQDVARSGTWFVPPEARISGRYASNINTERAYWVRLLGYLKWPNAAQFQATIAQQAHPVEVTEFGGMRIEHTQAMHFLGSIKEIKKIGPEIAKHLGVQVMIVLGEAAVDLVHGLTGEPPEQWEESRSKFRQLTRLNEEWRRLRGAGVERVDIRGEAWQRHSAAIQPLRRWLHQESSRVRPGHGDRGLHLAAGDSVAINRMIATRYAQKALIEYLTSATRHPIDQSRTLAEVIFNAIHALGFACDAEKGSVGVTGTRLRHGWSDRYGYRPTRGCMARANRAIRAAMLEPAVVKIASLVSGGL
jgi:hypothetical protein